MLLTDCKICQGSGYMLSHETVAYELERELIAYNGTDDEAALIAAHPSVQQIFFEKELQRNISFQICFIDDEAARYTIQRFGTKKEICMRKK